MSEAADQTAMGEAAAEPIGGAPAPDPAPAAEGLADAAPSQGIGENAPQDGPSKDWYGAPTGGYTSDGIEMPEGFELNETVAQNLAGVCQEMGLSQKAFSQIVNKMTPVLEEQQQAAVQGFREANLKAFYEDKELGGARAKETIASANKAYTSLVPQGLQDIFRQTGLNTHPDMIRMFHSISQKMSDDTVLRGGRSAAERPNLANFFNNSKMN